jgi:RNA-directed DNA polymerase
VYDRRTRADLSRCLADAFLAGVWNEPALLARAAQSLDRRPPWVPALMRAVLAAYHRPPADRPRELAAFIALALERHEPAEDELEPPRVRRWLLPESAMGRRRWPVPELASVGALADFLELSLGELEWLADPRGWERNVRDERLRHYRYSTVPRRSGPPRLIEAPKSRLKAIQRRVLHEILDWIPAHDAAHGFTRGRSVVSNAKQHVGRAVLLRLDLEDFFASIAARRVFGIFRTAGYPESVAYTLTALCTNAVPLEATRELRAPSEPRAAWSRSRLARRLAAPHLPQGAPTSPALANLASFGLDRRLSGLAHALELSYTRYSDDLTLSGSELLVTTARRVALTIAGIAHEEGFIVNERKSNLTTRSGRQQVCGVVVNRRPNVPRVEYDTIRAILHNAARDAPATQNRDGVTDFAAHLLGRITWVEQLNPNHGAKLRRQFSQITWSA